MNRESWLEVDGPRNGFQDNEERCLTAPQAHLRTDWTLTVTTHVITWGHMGPFQGAENDYPTHPNCPLLVNFLNEPLIIH